VNILLKKSHKHINKEIRNIRKSEIKLNGLLSSMEDLVFVFDKDGRFTFYHSKNEKELYKPPNKFIGKKHSEIMPACLNEMFIEAVKKNKNGKVAEYEYELKLSGKTRRFFVKLYPIIIKDKYEGSVAVSKDITMLKARAKKK